MRMKKIMGMDEAGRGPVLGGLFIGGVVFIEDFLPTLETSEINDSKKLSPAKREKLYDFIVENCSSYSVTEITNVRIDENSQNHGSLNDLEIEAMANLILELAPDVVYIDALGHNLDNFKKKLKSIIQSQRNYTPEIITEHKADEKFKVVGAASILAKVQRDRSISEYSKDFVKYGGIGSGYPSDEKTITFLRKYIEKNHKPPEIARHSWQTCKNLMNDLVNQKKLDEFF